jgi:hypothetical protein
MPPGIRWHGVGTGRFTNIFQELEKYVSAKGKELWFGAIKMLD